MAANGLLKLIERGDNMQIQPVKPIASTTSPKRELIEHMQKTIKPVYEIKYLGASDPAYIQPDGFTQAQVTEMGIVIAHFMGAFAKINAQKFLRIKQLEVNTY